ncbi:MAG: hypothetical protein O9340_06670 [Cyclobacteriaceae bacterium]|jgi:hypothetical protein|nr:hypothetical protein [Cyclobacteriaceae bacterium]
MYKRFFIILFLLSFSTSFAQKVKYKDIYTWLANKQYDEAEPFLKKYVKENDDNPNAFLFMGLLYEHKLNKADVLKETKKLLLQIDSSILYLNKAYTTITEKELRKNDEYYESFKRRDLRTGEFGVKLSDVQFFLEKKQQELKERADKVKLTNTYFVLSDSLYKGTQKLFANLVEKYRTNKSLVLQADDETLKQLNAISVKFDSCTKAFGIYKTNVVALSKGKYDQKISLLNIDDISKDGKEPANFFENDLKLWDYKIFADKQTKLIKTDWIPVRDQLVNLDIEINKLRNKLEVDSISVYTEIQKIETKLPYELMRTVDENPLPIFVLQSKINELKYKSLIVSNKKLRDSADYYIMIKAIQSEYQAIKNLDSLVSKFDLIEIDKRAYDYQHFITNTFNKATILKTYIRGLQEYSEKQVQLKKFELNFRTRGLKWLTSDTDSVALFNNPGEQYAFQPLLVIPDKFTTGLHYKDTATVSGYLFNIPTSRKPDLKFTFNLDKKYFSKFRQAFAKSILVTDPAAQIFFVLIYSESKTNKEGKYPVTVAKIYRSDGLAWQFDFLLDGIPATANFVSGELAISTSDARVYNIDKNGKLKQ